MPATSGAGSAWCNLFAARVAAALLVLGLAGCFEFDSSALGHDPPDGAPWPAPSDARPETDHPRPPPIDAARPGDGAPAPDGPPRPDTGPADAGPADAPPADAPPPDAGDAALPRCPPGTDDGTPGASPCWADEETSCEDGADNDKDGERDCDDADCAARVAQPGGCMGSADRALWRNLSGWALAVSCFPPESVGGMDCFGDTRCNVECVQIRTQLSAGCAACFGAAIACAWRRCPGECANFRNPQTPRCADCIDDRCGPDARACHGQLLCAHEYGCVDGVDNDGDGLRDSADPDCQG